MPFQDADGTLSLGEFRALLEKQHGSHKVSSDLIWNALVRKIDVVPRDSTPNMGI